MKKQEISLRFTFYWLILYLIGINAAVVLSQAVGTENLFTAIFGCLFVTAMLICLRKYNLLKVSGFQSVRQLNHRELLYYLPMLIYAGSNLWFGFQVKNSLSQITLISISMLCVGFIEEMIFRACLINVLSPKYKKAAVFISALLFGGLHMLNLLGGAEFYITLLQVLNTASFGLMCAAFYYRTNCIMPCILCHGIYNVCDTFMIEQLSSGFYLAQGLVILISLGYAAYLLVQPMITKASLR